MVKYCLDTHALVWYFRGQKTLSIKAKDALDQIFSGNDICFIPTMVILEAFYVSLKHKDFKFPRFFEALKRENIIIVPFDKDILIQSFSLPARLDIHDRIIVAVAKETESILMTKDRVISSFSEIETLW